MSPSSPEATGSLSHKKSAQLAMLLAALAMLGPFSVDTYLPAFPAIQASLHVSAIEVQQTLTAYMLAFAFMMLWHGAISDALGRRNIILVSLFVFAVASLGCAAAHTIHYLWIFRVLQGISAGAGIVVVSDNDLFNRTRNRTYIRRMGCYADGLAFDFPIFICVHRSVNLVLFSLSA